MSAYATFVAGRSHTRTVTIGTPFLHKAHVAASGKSRDGSNAYSSLRRLSPVVKMLRRDVVECACAPPGKPCGWLKHLALVCDENGAPESVP